jgi:hypothetical protein
VTEPKTEELTPVQKAWNKYKDTFDFMGPDDLMLFTISEQADGQGAIQRIHQCFHLKTLCAL